MFVAAKRGHTLIELVIVIVLLGVMGALGFPAAIMALSAYGTVQGDVVVLDKLRYATERIARELREVNDTDSSAATNFSINMSATAPSFTRTYRSCSDATCSTSTDTTSTITISAPAAVSGFSGNAVTLTDSASGVGAQVLIDEVSSLSFAYFNSAGTAAADSTDVRTVEISLTVLHDGKSYSQTTRVGLRNL